MMIYGMLFSYASTICDTAHIKILHLHEVCANMGDYIMGLNR